MAGVIMIDAKVLGQKKPLLSDWSIPFPPDLRDGGDSLTLRHLIMHVVAAEVEQFRRRQQERRLVRVLTAAQMQEGLAAGKVDSGGRDLQQTVNDEEAIGAALQAFEDGLYVVFVDGDRQEHLEQQVYLQPESRVSFVRLVMLAGG